jgi:hypothetical protein
LTVATEVSAGLKYEILYPKMGILAIAGTAKKPIKIRALAHFRGVRVGIASAPEFRASASRF